MRAIITIGMPASGKTTWAEEYCKDTGAINVNRDDIRMRIFSLEDYRDYKFTKEREKMVTEQCDIVIDACVKYGYDIVVSDTNINKGKREALVQKLVGLGYDVELKFFPVDFFEACKRNQNRRDKAPIPREVLYRMYRDYYDQFEAHNKYIPDLNKPSAYMFDVDGTLANMYDENGKRKRSPYEWDRVGEDTVIEPVAEVLTRLSALGEIIIVSARDGICYEETMNWLLDNEIPFTELIMRNVGDDRKDRVVKHELFDKHIRNNYNVLGVFDDRLSVSLLWYDLGLPLFKVGDPLLEF